MQTIQRILRQIVRLIDTLTNVLMLFMLFAIGLQVIARLIVGAPTVWAEELARYLLVAVTMLGSAALIQKNEHITIDIFRNLMPKRLGTIIDWLRDAIVIAVCGLLGWYGWLLVTIGRRQTSTGLGVKMSVPYLAIPIGAALIALVLMLSRLGTNPEAEE